MYVSAILSRYVFVIRWWHVNPGLLNVVVCFWRFANDIALYVTGTLRRRFGKKIQNYAEVAHRGEPNAGDQCSVDVRAI